MTNPFTIGFGREPQTVVTRIQERDEIVANFESDSPSTQIYMISGVRGSGKTVLMTTVARHLKEEGWFVINLNANRPLLESLAAKLYDEPELQAIFKSIKLNLSLFGIGVSIEDVVPISDIEVAVERMLEQIQLLGKRLLVTIDEITKSENVKIFTSSFQLFLRDCYPIYLIMTGLYENINLLQNDDTLTFLYRAPKIYLSTLDFISIKNRYQSVFKINDNQASELAHLTSGYPFAFQVLGYLCWQHKDKLEELSAILEEYDYYLREYVYLKIWKELSEKDRSILEELAKFGKSKVGQLRESLNLSSGLMSVYRERLSRKGLVDTREYGYLSIILPRFDQFVLEYGSFESF